MLVGVPGVSVRNHQVRREVSLDRLHPHGPAPLDADLRRLGFRHDPTAQLLEDLPQRLHHRIHAAPGEPDAALALQEWDHEVDGRRVERISAHEEGMERVDEPMAEVLEKAVDEGRHGAVGPELGHAREEPQHGSDGVEGLGPQSVGDDGVVDGTDLVHERVEPLRIGRIVLAHLLLHALGVAHVVQMGVVMEVDAVIGVQRKQLQIVLHPAPCGLEDGLDDARCGDEARTHVEDVAAVLQLVGAPTDLLALFYQGHLDPRGL